MATEAQVIGANVAGRRAWRAALADQANAPLEFPSNPYGDEWNNKPAQAFRRGFDSAARDDGYTYSRVDGEYHLGGEFQTDDLPELGDVRELA